VERLLGRADWGPMGDRSALAHPELGQLADRRYLSHLKAAEARLAPDPVRRALFGLITTTESAQRQGRRLTMADVKFNFSSLGPLG
jgi:hypothetical protein